MKRRRPRPAAQPRPHAVASRPRAARGDTVEQSGAPRITALVVDALTQALASVLRFDGPADAVMSRFFRAQPQLGGRERSLVAEAIFFALRRYATLGWLMQPAQPARAPRLAALITLARQHGLESLDPRVLKGDARAVERALAVKLNHAPASVQAELPHWLYVELIAQYPDHAALIDALKQSAPLDLRVNTIKATRAQVLAELSAHHVSCDATPYSPEGLRLLEKPGLTQWPAYREGRIEVQDEGSQLIARLVAPRRGEMVVDFCAGAGGKTLALGALMRSTGRLYAFDVHAKRLAGLVPRLKRSGLSNVHPVAIRDENDTRVKRLQGKCDRVLVDAPCSGSGTLRRNPDLKWRFSETEVERVGQIQRAVLSAAARLVKRRGRLVYSTCSLLARENQQVIDEFRARFPDFSLLSAAQIFSAQQIDIEDAVRAEPFMQMLPHVHKTDGFFAAVLQRD